MKKINPSSISLTLIFAFLFTGLGQVYLGKRKKGAVFLLIHVSAITGLLMYLFHPTLRVHSYILFYALMFMVFELYVIVDAYLTCIRRKALKSYLSLKEIPSIMFIPVIMFLFNGNILIARITKLNIVPVPPEPTVSMQPVIKKGDVFLVDKTKYRKSSPKLGDVIVFNFPNDVKKAFVKRVVARGGETIEIKYGDIYINNVLVKIPEIKNTYYYNKGGKGQKGKKITVPEGNYYVLGDNSSSSYDSRYWGFVRDEHIIGRAYKIIYPFERSGSVK